MKIVCIPAFNEEKSISDIVKRSLSYVDAVVVYDDGSTDNTSRIAEEAGAQVLRNEKNLGKGAALKSLFQHARKIDASVVVTIDGDGQFLPEEIPKLMKPVIENGFDIVIGYRFDNGDQMPSYRKMGNKLLDRITNVATNLPCRDTQSGFRAYSKKAISSIDFRTSGFGADAQILINASQKGLKITEEKVTVLYETGGKT
ncbi:MAG: glycosyltransferase family 2 protein, partial [Nitrosotalea sp.]